MKKNNLLRITWIVGIYATLVLILYLVVLYKVKWEDRDLNTYLYFYNCSGEVCTTDKKQDLYYGKIICKKDNCPYILEQRDNIAILAAKNNQIIFDYEKDKTISDKYKTAKFSSDNNYIVSNEKDEYAVIDTENNTIIDFDKMNITDYKNGYITYKEDDLYGITNKENNIDIKPNYEEVVLIDKNIYAYLEDNTYYIASYDTEVPINSKTYDYIASINNLIFAFSGNQLDILDNNLQSKLLMKIDCKYTYKVEKERATLRLRQKNNTILFEIYNPDGEKISYIYDIKNNKLFN